MNYTEIIGFAAAILSTAAFLPQVYKTWRTKDVSSLSMPMLLMFFTSIVLWLTYALLIKSPSMIFANCITVISAFLLVYFKIKYKNR